MYLLIIMILTDNTTLNLSIEKYNRLFLYLIMKSKKKYEKIYNKIKNINIKTIYKINSVTQVKTDIVKKDVEIDIVKQVVEDIVKQVETDIVENIVKQDETDIVKKEVEDIVKQVVEDIVENIVETDIVENIVKQDETDIVKKDVEDIVENIVEQVVVEQDVVEQDKFCMPCIIENDKKCICCKPKKLDLQLNTINRIVFPSYDELYLLMNITQQILFTKQIYICAKLLYDNITNNDLIDRVCKKIYDISGINGLEFVNTIIKSISIN